MPWLVGGVREWRRFLKPPARLGWRVAAVAWIASAHLPDPAAAAESFRIVARQGDPAPAPGGGALGEAENFLMEAAVGPGGHLLTGGLGSGFPGPSDFSGAFWVAAPGGALGWLARDGDPAPGAGGAALFESLGGSLSFLGAVAPRGEVVVVGTVPGTTVSGLDQGVWAGAPGGLELVALAGQPAPGAGGATYSEFYAPVMNPAGTVAFRAETSAGGEAGIWAGTAGAIGLAAREGGPAPGLPPGWTFRYLFDPVISADGRLCFFASAGNQDGDRLSGIWLGSPDNLAPAARSGDPAPGLGGDATYLFFDTGFTSGQRVPSWTGEFLAFTVPVDDGGVLRQAVVAGPPGELVTVAAAGLAAPGLTEPLSTVFCEPVITASGKMAFSGEVEGENPKVVFWGGFDGGVAPVARQGQPLPGDDSGDLVTFTRLNTFDMGREGQLVFAATVSGNPYKNQWVVLPDGTLEFIGRGLAFSTTDGDYVLEDADCMKSGGSSFSTDLTGHNGSDGRPTCFGPAGQFVFTGMVAPAAGGRGEESLVSCVLPGFGGDGGGPVPLPTLSIEAGRPAAPDARITILDPVPGATYSIFRSTHPAETGERVFGPVEATGEPLPFDDTGTLATRPRAFYRATADTP